MFHCVKALMYKNAEGVYFTLCVYFTIKLFLGNSFPKDVFLLFFSDEQILGSPGFVGLYRGR